MLIQTLKEKYQEGVPIYLKDILLLFPNYTKAYIFRLLKKAEQEGMIKRFSHGVYCLPKKSFIGPVTMTSQMVAENRYISNGDAIYGVYSGLSLINHFCVSTQVPNVLEIVTNREATRKRTIDIDGVKFVIRKSRFEITKDNYPYYTILQLFLELGDKSNLNDFAKEQIKEYLSKNNIQKERLLKYALDFPSKAIKGLIDSEVLYGAL